MKKPFHLFTKSILFVIIAIGIAFMHAFVGRVSLNTLGGVGNSLIEELSDVNIFTDAEELQFGKAFAEQHAQEVKFYTDPVVTKYISNLGQSLVLHSSQVCGLIHSVFVR